MHADSATLLVDEPTTTAKNTKKTTRATSQDQSNIDLAAIHQQFGSEIAAVFGADTAPQSAAGTGERADPSPSSGYRRPAGPLARSKQPPQPKTSSGSKQPAGPEAEESAKPATATSRPAMPASDQASVIPDALAATCLANAVNLRPFTPSGYAAYLDRVLEQAGNPTDPVLVMLYRQSALCHLASMGFLALAGGGAGHKGAELYSGVAVHLMAELRRTASTIQAFPRRPDPASAEAATAGDDPELAPTVTEAPTAPTHVDEPESAGMTTATAADPTGDIEPEKSRRIRLRNKGSSAWSPRQIPAG